MGARFFRLALVMLQEGVELGGERLDLDRQRFVDAGLGAGADLGDGAAHAAQRPQAVKSLQCRHRQQAEAEHAERAHQRAPQNGDLLVERVAALRHLEAPARRRARQPDVAFEHAQGLVAELAAVIGVDIEIAMIGADGERAVPQRAGAERLAAGRADLEVEARIGFEKALVGRRPVEQRLAVRSDLGRGDQSGEDVIELPIEIVGDRAREHAIERKTADAEQQDHPQSGDADHAPGERPGGRAAATEQEGAEPPHALAGAGSSSEEPSPRIVVITSGPSFLRMRVTNTSIVFESRSKS